MRPLPEHTLTPILVSPVPSSCAQLDNDPLFCPPCEEAEEDPDTVNMAACENIEPNDLVHIEDISRKTTIAEILNIVSKRIHYLGFPKMDLTMGLLQPTSERLAAESGDSETSPPHDEMSPQVPAPHNSLSAKMYVCTNILIFIPRSDNTLSKVCQWFSSNTK